MVRVLVFCDAFICNFVLGVIYASGNENRAKDEESIYTSNNCASNLRSVSAFCVDVD